MSAHPFAHLRTQLPALLVPAAMLLAWMGMRTDTWITLTLAGLSMGMLLFLMASGLTLIFGLMDVLNFGHGALITVGAYAAGAALRPFLSVLEGDLAGAQFAVLAAALLLAMLACALLGVFFERWLIVPVYGQHLRQILITMGGMIVIEQVLIAFWGAEQVSLPVPQVVRGVWLLGESMIEKFRVLVVVLGVLVFLGMTQVLQRTRVGLFIRAAVENREMVEAMGCRARRLFVGVFAAGAALAGLGGALFGLYKEALTPAMGGDMMVLVFIVIIIGGLGSVWGCFLGAVLLSLCSNYIAFLWPKAALLTHIVLLLLILLWRPAGMYPVVRR